ACIECPDCHSLIHLHDTAIQVRRTGPSERLWRWCRRHPRVASFAGSAAVVLVLVGVGGLLVADRERELRFAADKARHEAVDTAGRETRARGEAEEARNKAQRLLYAAHMNLAQRAWEDANVAKVVDLLEFHRPERQENDLRGFDWYYWQWLIG